jgi:hypothetical protein
MFSWGRTSAKLVNFQINFGGLKGSGNTAVEKRDLSGFTKIDAGGAFVIEIVAQKDFSVEVEADDNLLQHIETRVDGQTLEISTNKRFSTKSPLRIRIAAPNIDELEISGASKVNLSGARNETLKVDASGASKIKLEGETKDLHVELSGASKLEAEGLKAINSNIDASGASSAEVSVTGDLTVDLSGASKVIYSGDPANLEKSTSGASSVRKK